MSIPFIDLEAQRRRIADRLEAAVTKVMEHGRFIHGPEVAELERRLAEFAGVKHCVACANGTDSLVLVLMAEGIGPGDAVFVPSFTFIATAEAVSLVGATPVFCDVFEDTFNLDPDSLAVAVPHAEALGLRPRAVIPVDLFGQPADYRRILPLAERLGLMVLSDAAQSFGASLDSRRVGGFGKATSISFFPAKPLGCYGDGGAVLTDDDELADTLRSLRVHGQGQDKYDNVRVGLNSRLDTIQAAILLEKLAIFPDEVEARQEVAGRYDAALSDGVSTPRLVQGAQSVWAQYTVRLSAGRRDEAMARLKEEGVPSMVYYTKPLHLQDGYRQHPISPSGVPVSERLPGSVLSLPMHPYLDERQQRDIIDAMKADAGRRVDHLEVDDRPSLNPVDLKI